jgi:hypothetical protein
LLLANIKVSGGVTLIVTLANAVHFVVARSTVVVSVLTGTSNGPLDVTRMPGSNTGDLTETLVCLSRKLLGSPSAGNTGETVTLGNGNNIDHLILLEDGGDLDWLLEETMTELNLIGNAASIDLDFHQMSLLLLEGSLADLGVGEDTDNGAVLLDALKLTGDGGSRRLRVLLGVLGESLLLASVPVLVESALYLVAQVLSPNGSKGTETSRSFDVTN